MSYRHRLGMMNALDRKAAALQFMTDHECDGEGQKACPIFSSTDAKHMHRIRTSFPYCMSSYK